MSVQDILNAIGVIMLLLIMLIVIYSDLFKKCNKPPLKWYLFLYTCVVILFTAIVISTAYRLWG